MLRRIHSGGLRSTPSRLILRHCGSSGSTTTTLSSPKLSQHQHQHLQQQRYLSSHVLSSLPPSLRSTGTTLRFRRRQLLVSSSSSSSSLVKKGSSMYQRSIEIVTDGQCCSSSTSAWNWNDKVQAPFCPPDYSERGGGDDMDEKTKEDIVGRCASIYASIMPLNDKIRGPLPKHADRGTSLPFVLLVGNHSSGKSSFINYILSRNVQTAGVAPTDDCFTVIAPGPSDVDQDGPALVGDPDMGFANLRQFGPTLIHHTQLKIRRGTATEDFMMVDSPGMIDSPGGGREGMEERDRGYDFPGVVRWFAERADVVLLFFDPDKPGTTGETMSVLLRSLGGMDHKLMIILNKADQFQKIHDFARAYGSLCWNLSKVIPRKDLPRIYTMCLPTDSPNQQQQHHALDKALADLHQTRDEVVSEVMKAPKRRIDNVITHLNDSVQQLLMHAVIAEDTRHRFSKARWDNALQEIGGFTLGTTIAMAGLYWNLPWQFNTGVMTTTLLGVGGLVYFNRSRLLKFERHLTSGEELSATFQRTHSREVAERNEFVASVWQRVKAHTKMSLEGMGLRDVPTVKTWEVDELRRILEEDIPIMRRWASPRHFGTVKRHDVRDEESGGKNAQ